MTAVPTRDDIIEALKKVEDPELFLDIWFLGLVYSISIEGSDVGIEMTFTSMLCPAGPMLVDQVQTRVKEVPGVESVAVEVVFTPPWQPSDEVKQTLGIE